MKIFCKSFNTIIFLGLILALVIFNGCSSSETKHFDELQKNQAKVLVSIGDSPFYDEESIFIPQLTFGSKFYSLNLVDQFGGNLQIQISNPNWLNDKQEPIKASPDNTEPYPSYGSLLIGKRDGNNLEGYVLFKGSFQWKKLTKSQLILDLSGFLVKPMDAFIEENQITFKGKILLKEPDYELTNIEEKEVFNP